MSSGGGGAGAGMGIVSHRARQLESGDCGSTRSCSRALDALCYVLLVASILLILGPHNGRFSWLMSKKAHVLYAV